MIRTVILVLGIGLMAIGIWRGELADILHKSIVICLECIGI
jgi:hypothetical protein